MDTVHPFERAGLGKAPFRFIGMTESKFQAAPGEPVRAGSTCDYCPSAIMMVYRIKSADGREFKVGCECVRKVDAKLAKAVDAATRAHKRAKREAEAKDVEQLLHTVLACQANRDKLAAPPHPVTFMAANGKTLLDWADWMLARAGAKGRKEALAAVERVCV